MMTRIKFQQNLDDLKERLLIMAGMAEQAIQRVDRGVLARATCRLCELVFQSEPVINRLEREIDQMALDLLAMEQPMAIDLRFILSVIRINADLERVGDQAVNIAVRVTELGACREHRSAGGHPQAGARCRRRWCARRCRRSSRRTRSWRSRCCMLDDQVDEMNRDGVLRAERADQGEAGADAAEPERADHLAQPGAGWRPRDQHRGGRDLLGARRGCAPPLCRKRRRCGGRTQPLNPL